MRVIICALFLIALFSAAAQEKAEWQRLSTFQNSTLDMNISDVTFGTDYTGRVMFRVELSKSESVPGNKSVKYKSAIQTMEFRCPERQYRVVEVKRFDGKGKLVDSDKADSSAQWKEVKSGSFTEDLFTPACKLIADKKRSS